jgi:hypothetical protein
MAIATVPVTRDRCRKGGVMQSLPPGFVSRVAAVVMGGALVFALQDDLAEWLAASPEVPVVATDGAESAEHSVIAPRTDHVERQAASLEANQSTVEEPEPEPVQLHAAEATPIPRPERQAPPAASADSRASAESGTSLRTVESRIDPGTDTGSIDTAEDSTTGGDAISEPAVVAAGGCQRMTDRFEAGDEAAAGREATELFVLFGGHTEMTAALAEEGVPTHRARLWTILALHTTGDEEAARELARLTRASYPGNEEVGESLRRWSILRPRIVEFESFVNEQQRLVLRGTVKNEDIGAIRKVKVRGEALDDRGNVIAAIDVRVKPKLLASDLAGEFEILFKNIADHERIQRTRATVIHFEYEVAANR